MLLKKDAASRYADWTVPPQSVPRPLPAAARLGWAMAIGGAAMALGSVAARLIGPHQLSRPAPPASDEVKAARRLAGGAAVLAFSVMTDSGLEHYRGAYHNPAMYIAPTAAGLSLAHHLHMLLRPHTSSPGRLASSGLSLAIGAAGLAFHVYNVRKREGGWSLENLFYAAPLGAPAALAAAGLAGLAAGQLVAEAEEGAPPTLLGLPGGALVGAGAITVMLGTVGEAALLHFRGAFHDPFMFVPVTVPPAAAAALLVAILRPQWRPLARWLLRLTAAIGVVGAGFHIYGVSRNMGGFYNWSQNLLNGPPIPAPPSFTGVALAGLAALNLLEAS